MTFKRQYWLTAAVAAAALAVGLGVGLGAARLIDQPPAASADNPVDDDHDEEGGEAFVALPPEAAAAAGVIVTGVGRGGGEALKLPGRAAYAPGAEARVDAPLAGAVVRVHVGPGDRVAAGSPLVTLRSPDGAAARAGVDAAAAAAEVALAAERRDVRLFEQGWIARSRLEITVAEARRAEAELGAARARMGAYGGPGSDGQVVVRSPIAGVVTEVIATPGRFLHEEALLVATVADTRRIELVFEAPPSAAALLRVGDRLESTQPGEDTVTGVVLAIAPVNDSGVVVVRARPDGAAPPAGSVMSARIVTESGSAGLTVPIDAVQTVEGVTSVFVAETDGFRAVPVVTGRTAGGRVEIVSGLTGDERIAGRGAFLLKAELAKGEAEHGH